MSRNLSDLDDEAIRVWWRGLTEDERATVAVHAEVNAWQRIANALAGDPTFVRKAFDEAIAELMLPGDAAIITAASAENPGALFVLHLPPGEA